MKKLVLSSLLVLFVAPACEPKELDPCVQQSDCGDKFICVSDRCLTQKAADERCKTNESFAAACAGYGECTWKDGKCAVGGADDCKASKGCSENAKCSFDEGTKKCKIGGDADCKQSEFCTKLKRCKHDAKTDKCVPGSTEECKAQTDCKAAAVCTYDEKSGGCIITAEDCKASAMCEQFGLCALDEKAKKCAPGSEEDCKKGPDCKGPDKLCAWDDEAKKCVKE